MIHITEDKLKAAIQICLGGDSIYTEQREAKLVHDIKALSITDVRGMLHSDIEKLLRYAIKQWSSLNEQGEPDHEDLVQYWLDGDCKEWIQSNYR